ncbi:K02A2.6-like [Cordylochernes scorpioides]|uniref:RNA-directed DNA polymerase n=1 Tax=Cordylochernes scorpioides TaxID=51811 RepID=A0ABY6K4N4_9ARAC|nr:K02A2.6-like [Cordylochernes scorpioides]
MDDTQKLLQEARILGGSIEDEEFITAFIRGLPPKYNLVSMQFDNYPDATISDIRRIFELHEERNKNNKDENAAYNMGHKFNKTFKKIQVILIEKENPNASFVKSLDIKQQYAGSAQASLIGENHNQETAMNLSSPEFNNKCKWILDSGATSHMSTDINLLDDFQDDSRKITLLDDRFIKSNGIGTVEIYKDDNHLLTLKEVLYVPELNSNLISVSKITEDEKQIIFDENGARIIDNNGSSIITAKREDNIYTIDACANIKLEENKRKMANYMQIAAPEGFNFGKPNEWPIWFKRFQRYRIASGLSEKSENEQDYFIGKRNVIYERAKFNRRSQGETEPVEEFITNLYVLAENCSYGILKEEMIRDRLVVGVKNFNLSEKLQLESELTLEKAIQIVRQSESVKNQQKEIRQDTENRNVDVIDRIIKDGLLMRNVNVFDVDNTKDIRKNNVLLRMLFATSAERKVCHTKTIQEVSSSQNNAFIGIVGMQENAEDKWCEVIKVNDQSIKFKIDTGAEVSVMPEGIYLQHFGYLKTEKADNNLFAVSKKIEVNGMFQAFLESKRQKCEESIYIVKGVARPLLSCRASEILGIVRRINIVEDHAPTKLDPMLKFPKLFTGLGKIDIPYEIKLKEGAKPYSIYTPRRVPIPLMKELQMELERMTSNGVIEKVEGSSEWCSPMVLVAKPSGKLRICVDLSILNKNILREIHPIPVVEHTLAQLKGAKLFTKLDANSGFWQIPLSSESSALTTFITPFGRFRFKRLPFGISFAPEIFQKRMGQILEGLEGILCHMDDIMVYGSHAKKDMIKDSKQVSKSGLTLNKDKCKFAVTTIKFLGHQIDPNGIQVDLKRKRAILEFPKPRSVKELKQFLGMVNFSARFVPNLAEISHPLNKLLSKKEEWIWGDDQDRAFDQIKKSLTSAQGLALYDPSLPITVSADASSFGLGAVIWQTKDGLRQVIAYASRTLSETEKRYAQIEKEALAITWACEKFKQYIQGLVISLETDHKPLVPIFTSKNIDDLTPRIQRLRLRIMRYSYKIVHTPGKNLIVADALSRSPRMKVGTQELEEELCAYVQQVVSFMPISDVRVKEIKESQDKDQVIQNIIKYTQEGWPERPNVSMSESQYWPAKDDFSVENGILLKGSRYVIPENIRKGLVQRIHKGHLGIVKCRERAKGSVWWPRITSEIEEMVRTCPMCIEERTNRHQPLLPSELPNCPWEKVGVDLFTLKGQNYLLITDYYSRYPEIARLEDMISASVIVHCKSIFARHGISLEVRSDNGPQFGSLFKEFAHDYGFTHVTSSPRYPQSNGFIESFVKIVKERISKSKDPYLALLAYRATPLANGFSPAELSMGRRVRTTIPTPTTQYKEFEKSRSYSKGKTKILQGPL